MGLEDIMLDNNQVKVFKEKLEAEGEKKVRDNFARGIYGKVDDPRTKAPMVKNWLDDKEKERAKQQSNEQVRIAKEANKIAQHGNIIGWVVGIGGLIIGIIGVGVSIHSGVENNELKTAQQNVYNNAKSIQQNNYYYNLPPTIKDSVDKIAEVSGNTVVSR